MITDIAQALRLAETAGRVMLENGAETYRAEDTVIHVCRSMGLPDVPCGTREASGIPL